MVSKLEVELGREKLERNWSEAELGKVKTFWDVTKQELENKKHELINKEGSAEAAEERHQLEIKVRPSAAYQKITTPNTPFFAGRVHSETHDA